MPTLFDQPRPVEAPFLKKYNERLELPISVVGSVVVHTALVGLVVLGLFQLMNRSRKEAVPIMMLIGPDEVGEGTPGSGDGAETLAPGFNIPTADDIKRLTLEPLPAVKDQIAESINVTSDEISIPDTTTSGLSLLDKTLRDAILGRKPGTGDGKPGNSNGDLSADSTKARSLRWVIRFNVKNGSDYLRQLSVLKAILLLPVPPENKQMRIISNLETGGPNQLATKEEMKVATGQIRFMELSAKSIGEIVEALQMDFTPTVVIALFTKEFEEQLANEEEEYGGRTAEDIKQTIFKVTVTGDTYTINVIGQTLKTR